MRAIGVENSFRMVRYRINDRYMSIKTPQEIPVWTVYLYCELLNNKIATEYIVAKLFSYEKEHINRYSIKRICDPYRRRIDHE